MNTMEVDGENKMNDLLPAGAASSSGPQKRRSSVSVEQVKEFFEKEPGVKYAKSEGFHGTVSHILTYDPSRVRTLMGLFISPDLTVFYNLKQWGHHFVMVGYAVFLMLMLGQIAFPDGEMGSPACSDDDPLRNRNMCSLNTVLEEGTDAFQWLIGFILAGFVGTSVATWATRRRNYAALCGAARNLNILVAAFVPLDPTDAEMMATRKTLGRWVMLAMELAMLKARGAMDTDEGRQHLQNMSLLEPGEWEAMVPGDRHSTIFWWIQLELVRLQKAGFVAVEYVTVATNHISAMRAQANDLMSSLDRDKPYPYVSICGLLVKMNVFIFSTWKGVQWAIWYFSFGDELQDQSKLWIDMAILFMWNLGYVGLYDLGYFLHNPFGGRRIDVAHELIFGGIRTLSTELALGEPHLPPHAIKMRKKGLSDAFTASHS